MCKPLSRYMTVILVGILLATPFIFSIQHSTYTPDNTVIIFDFDGVILTRGLQRWKKIKQGTANIINQLKEKGYRVDGGTNNSLTKVRYYQNKFPRLFRHFTTIKSIASKNDKLKPHRSYFMDYCTRYADKNKKHMIFIDDKYENIQAAQTCGFVTIHFKDAQQLEHDLQKMGIL